MKNAESLARYIRTRGWKDLIFLVVVLSAGRLAKSYLAPSDYQKWKARPKLNPEASGIAPQPGKSGLPPCLFIVPPHADAQPVVSGTVGDCVLLTPDGKKLDLIEVDLARGIIPVRTDLYLTDTIPLAF